MTTPVTPNWDCNQWETDGSEAAACPALIGPNWAIVEEAPFSATPMPRTAEDVYNAVTADWPDIAPVISSDRHAVSGDQDALTYIRDVLRPETIQCYHWAVYQLHVAGFRTTGKDPAAATFYKIYSQSPEDVNKGYKDPIAKVAGAERGTVDLDRTEAAVNYVKGALAKGRPILAGIRMWGFDESPNSEGGRPTTNHFVVIVGMGTDILGKCFKTYDYLYGKDGDTHNFYPSPALRFEDVGTFCTMSQIRESAKE